MIKKIDPASMLEKAREAMGTTQPKIGSLDFRAILQEKLEGSKPIEKMLIDSLLRAVEAMMESPSGQRNFFLPFPAPQAYPSQPQQRIQEIDFEPAMPRNLQGAQNFEPIIREAAEKNGVDPSLVQAVIQAESSGNPKAVSSAGAQGLMQLMPGTAKELGVKDPFDPAENIMAGTRYLRRLLDRYQGNTRLALAAYNWGMGNLENRPHALPRETKEYIAKVEQYYQAHLINSRIA